MKVAALMRVASYPLFPVMLQRLCSNKKLNHLVLSFDSHGYNNSYAKNSKTYDGPDHYGISGPEWYSLISKYFVFPDNISVDLYKSDFKGVGGLEDMVRRLDNVRPDYVLLCDTDESFDYENGWYSDFDNFINSKKDIFNVSFSTVTDDDRKLPAFPRLDHCKAFKWKPDVTFIGTHGFCEPIYKNSTDKKTKYKSSSKMLHFPFFTKSMQKQRISMYGKNHPMFKHIND